MLQVRWRSDLELRWNFHLSIVRIIVCFRAPTNVHSMSSYRDPNCSKTADIFQSCAEWAADARFTDEDVTQVSLLHVPTFAPTSVNHCYPQAKLSLFSFIDAPLPPSLRGLSLFNLGLSDESRQRFRDGNI
jgi:hypothetical protein